MSKIKNGFSSNLKWITSILLSLCLAVVVIFAVFIQQLQVTVDQDTKIYLKEVASHIARLVNTRIRDDMKTFTSLMYTYQELDDDQEQDEDEFLMNKKELYGFTHISFVDELGEVQREDGVKVSYRGNEAYQNALMGEVSSSWTRSSPYDNNETIVYAMPIEDRGKQRIAIAEKSTKVLVDSLSLDSFDGAGSSFIIDPNGRLALKSNNMKIPKDYVSYYEILYKSQLSGDITADEVIQQVENRNTGTFSYKIRNKSYIVTYLPLEVMDWTLFSIVSSDVVSAKTVLISRSAFLVGFITVVLFLFLVLLLVYQQKGNQKNLEEVIFVDALTKGKSRVRFELDVKKKLQSAKSGRFALISLNIDKFKLINELYSLEDGNKTLSYVYRTIACNLKNEEEVSRYDADSFVILMRSGSNEELVERLNEISIQVNAFNDGLEFKYYLTMSAGIYVVQDPHMDFVLILDRALTARKSVENHEHLQYLTYGFYSQETHMKLHQEKQIVNLMFSGIRNQEFVVYLQPKVDLKTNRIIGAEALVRWISPIMGFISPNQFIPIFEKNGFILQLDLYIFEEVCKIIRHWLDSGIKPIPISVNMSLAHLKKNDFLQEYLHVQQRYEIPPSYLELELTETIEAENLRALQKMIEKLHEVGFHYALDDFGSGYSSLNMLKDISVDTLKLDRAFFDDSFGSGEKRGESVVKSVIELAKQLKIKTVAEGVESLKQLELLRNFGCDQVQGYVFSKPLPLKEFEKLLLSEKNMMDKVDKK